MSPSSKSSGPDRPFPWDRTSGVLCRPAEESFRKGLEALRQGESTVALALFEAAIEIERRSGAEATQPRYRSFYGVSLAENPARAAQALDLCRRAAEEEFFNPDIFLNLAKVQFRLGHRRDAHKSARRGLALDRGHPGLVALAKEMGIRRRPPVPFLSRSHFINVALGRMFRRSPAAPPTTGRSNPT